MEEKIIEALDDFTSCSLETLQSHSLMDRIDSKFAVPLHVVPALLKAINADYNVLEVDGKRCLQYENVYYDTRQLNFYHTHHQGRLNRFKVRVRNYVDSRVRYLEVKFKNNKRRTIKERVPIAAAYPDTLREHQDFLEKMLVPDRRSLVPSQRSRYDRIALDSKQNTERVTIDLRLRFKTLITSAPRKNRLQGVAIVEVKQNAIDRSSPVIMFMKKNGIRPTNLSKYCLGLMMASIEDGLVRFNRFKKIHLHLGKVHSMYKKAK